MVEGTGLENQRRKRPQVRILSFPPRQKEALEGLVFVLMKIDSSQGSHRARSARFPYPVLSAKIKRCCTHSGGVFVELQ